MPPRERAAFPEPPAPKLLSTFWVWFFRGLIAFSFCSFVTASFGTWVLSGEPHSYVQLRKEATSAAALQLARLDDIQGEVKCLRNSLWWTDHDRKSWISNTAFADYWRGLIEWNQVGQA